MKTIIETEESKGTEPRKLISAGSKLKKLRNTVITVLVFTLVVAVSAGVFGAKIAANRAAAEVEKVEREKANLVADNQRLEEENKLLKESPMIVTEVTPEISLDLIHSEIRDIGELATTEYLFTDAAKYSDSLDIKKFNIEIPLTEKSFIVKWNGVIKAGIDLDAVSVSVNEEDKRIAVFVPKAKILSYEVDSGSVEVIDEKNNLINQISVEDKVKFDAATEEEMKQRAIENGLLVNAQKHAQDLLTNLLVLNEAIGNEYEIVFTVFA